MEPDSKSLLLLIAVMGAAAIVAGAQELNHLLRGRP